MSGPVDPCDLPTGFSPAYVEARDQLVFVADVTVEETGWARLTEWDSGKVLLPPHQCGKVRLLETERVDNGIRRRLAADDLRRDACSSAESDETERELFTDGGTARNGSDYSRISRNPLQPQEQSFIPIGRILPDCSTFAAYTDSQRSQTAATRLESAMVVTQKIGTPSYSFNDVLGYFGRSLHSGTERSEDGGSQ